MTGGVATAHLQQGLAQLRSPARRKREVNRQENVLAGTQHGWTLGLGSYIICLQTLDREPCGLHVGLGRCRRDQAAKKTKTIGLSQVANLNHISKA